MWEMRSVRPTGLCFAHGSTMPVARTQGRQSLKARRVLTGSLPYSGTQDAQDGQYALVRGQKVTWSTQQLILSSVVCTLSMKPKRPAWSPAGLWTFSVPYQNCSTLERKRMIEGMNRR